MRTDLRATKEESERPLPGDQLVRDPDVVIMNGVFIDAPTAKVWPWLAQMGSGRAGWYAYDFVDNDGVPSANDVVPSLQQIRVGDVMPSLPGATDSFVITLLEPGRDLVLTVAGTNGTAGVSWEFFLEPCPPAGTRLLVRGRVSKDWPSAVATQASSNSKRPIEYVYKLLGRIPRKAMFPIALMGHGAMQARQLRGIKRRSERASRTQLATQGRWHRMMDQRPVDRTR